jgi:hypothetical protein
MRAKSCLAGLVAAGLTIGSLSMAGSASACKGPQSPGTQTANHRHDLRGRIVSVNNNSITLEMPHHHKKGQAAAGAAAIAAQPVTKTFQIGAGTRVAFFSGEKAKLATLNDLKPGEEVAIEAPGGMAQAIAIMGHEHHKKAA